MRDSPSEVISDLLQGLKAGRESAFDELLPLVYDELHQIARQRRRRWEGDDTLDTTALVHEAYLRLVAQSAPDWRSRSHFLAVAATAMRQILIDYSKRRHAAKRGGAMPHHPLHRFETGVAGTPLALDEVEEVVAAVDDALRRLGSRSPRQCRIVECRFFAGMTILETAEALGLSPATVKRGWAMAQAWLYRDLRRLVEPPG